MAIDLANAPSKIPRITLRILARESFEKSSASTSAAQNKATATAPKTLMAPKVRQLSKSSKTSTWQYYLKAFQLFGNMKRARRKEYEVYYGRP